MKLTTAFLLCLLAGTSAFCQSDSTGTATICFIRSTGFTGSAMKFRLFVDGKLACKVPNNRYVKYPVTPGNHSIAVQTNGHEPWPATEKLDVNMEAGKTSFYTIAMASGFADVRVELNAVDERTATGRMGRLKESACTGD